MNELRWTNSEKIIAKRAFEKCYQRECEAVLTESTQRITTSKMGDEIDGFYKDDGTKINPELIPKPDLCITCKKNDAGGKEEILCILNRIDQKDEESFRCEAYEPRSH